MNTMSTTRLRDGMESGGSFCSMPPLDAMWDSLHVTSGARSHLLHHDGTSLNYKSRSTQHGKGNNRGWPSLPRYAFRESSARENSSTSCMDRQPGLHTSTPKSEHSVNGPRSEQVASSSSAVSRPPQPPNLPTAPTQQPPNAPSATAPMGPYMVAGPWAPAIHPHVPLMASGHLPPVGMPTQVLTHSMLPATAPPSILPLVMYNTPVPHPLMGVLGAGGMQVPLPPQGDPTSDKMEQSFNAAQCMQYLQRSAFGNSLVWDLLAEVLEEEELPEILEELRGEHQHCAGWFSSDPEYQAVCGVLADLTDSTVSPLVPGVVSEVIDELHRRCVHSPRAQWQDALLSTALEVVDEMVQEIVEEEVNATLYGEHLEVCGAELVKELAREVAEESYHEVALTTRAHRSEEAASFVSDYLVEQLIFEEALDICAEGPSSTLLTRETVGDYLLDDVILSSLLDVALSESRGP